MQIEVAKDLRHPTTVVGAVTDQPGVRVVCDHKGGGGRFERPVRVFCDHKREDGRLK